MDIILQRDGNFAVQSESGPQMYTVGAKGTGCTCPHATYRQVDCKHAQAVRAHLAAQTTLGRAADKAANLTEQELLRFSKERAGTAAGCACLLELAVRRANAAPRPIPEGVEAFLVGATPEEQERALACYR